jgi:hypothetical protein
MSSSVSKLGENNFAVVGVSGPQCHARFPTKLSGAIDPSTDWIASGDGLVSFLAG